MKKFKFTINGNDYDVEIVRAEGNIMDVEVNGTSYKVDVHRELPVSKTPTLVRAAIPYERKDEKIKKKIVTTTSSSVKSPLPGTITKILVKVGDEVKLGDKLLMMEAMKMENSVLAEKNGTVKAVKVSVGDAVMQNDILLEIE